MRKLIIILAILAQPHFVVQAYESRGYFAIGGEWLVIPLIIVVYLLIDQVKMLWKEAMK